MYRFLLRPRWIAGHVLLLVGVVTFVNLGFWQLRRLDARRTHNALVTERLEAQPVALDELLSTVGPDVADLEYRRVTVSGRYQAAGQLLTAPRSRDGRPGPQVLTVLQHDGGAVLVDRGWIPFDRRGAAPAPPSGEVRVEGIVRAPEPGGIGTGEQVARIVPDDIGERIGQPLPAYYVQLWQQQPPGAAAEPGSAEAEAGAAAEPGSAEAEAGAAAEPGSAEAQAGAAAPLPAGPPELSEGSHQSYALQWFSFALIALIGYPVLVWHTAREPAPGPRDVDAGERRREPTRIR